MRLGLPTTDISFRMANIMFMLCTLLLCLAGIGTERTK